MKRTPPHCGSATEVKYIDDSSGEVILHCFVCDHYLAAVPTPSGQARFYRIFRKAVIIQ